MKGSRSAGRPQRQARTGVTYKESDDEDGEFVPNARLSSDFVGRRTSLRSSVIEVEELGIAKGRRTLTLKRARFVEPPVSVAKEYMDVDEIGRAAPKEKPAPSPDHQRQFLQFVEPADDVPNSYRENSAFECLLEAVSGASGDGEEEGPFSGQHSGGPKITAQSGSRTEQEEGTTSAAYAPELLAAYSAFERTLLDMKGVKMEDTEETNALRKMAHSSDEESRLTNSSTGKGTKDTVEAEKNRKREQDYPSSADEKQYCRRGKEDKQHSMSSADRKKDIKKKKEYKQDQIASADGKKDVKKDEENSQDHLASADWKKDIKKDEEYKQVHVASADGKKDVKDKEDKQDSTSAADEKKYINTGKKDQQDNMSSADRNEDSKKGDEDKQYSLSSTDEDQGDDEEAEDSWNESSDASDSEKKGSVKEKNNNVIPATKPSPSLKTFAKKIKVLKKDSDTAGRVLLPAKTTSVPPLLPKKRPALWVGNKPFVSPVPAPTTLPSPTVAHRRVVGLSRRHRPPPLHPYLLGS